MTEQPAMIQARVPAAVARQADEDAALLGLPNRSEAVREGLRLLHRRAREHALTKDYDDFYNGAIPPSDVSAIGDQVAAMTMAGR